MRFASSALVFAAGSFILARTRWGESIYLLGDNPIAARLAGIPNDRIVTLVYALSGLCAALAGLVLIARLDSAQPVLGQGYEFDAIAAVVVGGTSFAGGQGSLGGTLLGALLIETLNNGLNLLNVSSLWEQVVKGGDRTGAAVLQAAEMTPERVVHLMVGRELRAFPPKTVTPLGEVMLRARGLRRGRDLAGVDIELRRGEIVGVAGLVGAGRTFLARALFGADRLDAGEIWVGGQAVHLRSPRDAIRLGIAFVPGDRKNQGLFAGQSVRSNIAASLLNRLSRLGLLLSRRIDHAINQMIQRLGIRTPSPAQRARNLSGGNQQKVVIARWLALDPKVLILDEPTRGIDVAAKAEIHNLMSDLARQGMAILMVSSELPEVLGVSDRVLVMREGKIVAALDRAQATQDAIMRAATGQG